MLFNSLDFALFFPLIFLIYWGVLKNSTKKQNWLLLLASYFFYGSWDWRFLFLIFLSSALDYFIGIKINNTNIQAKRKAYLGVSLFFNLGSLVYFKYANFFIDSFNFTLFGNALNQNTLKIILPAGISFYTFQTLSYSLDIYNKKIKPTLSVLNFFTFVCFFPQLVAGPIERASNLLPQFKKQKTFSRERSIEGLRQILWGLIKKIVIADSCAPIVNEIFLHHTELSGVTLFVGAILFSFQIYGDFSGYSDIAIGSARMLGFDLMKNFSYPYFSKNIAEFWKKWHISLSSWFKDYLYIPLGGSRNGIIKTIRNILIIFLISGLWHGANFTFIMWGAIHGVLFIPISLFFAKNNEIINKKIFTLFRIFITFTIVTLTWIYFRADTITIANNYLTKIIFTSFSKTSVVEAFNYFYWKNHLTTFILLIFFITIEWLQKELDHPFQFKPEQFSKPVKYMFYYVSIAAIAYYSGSNQDFIYFQF